MSLRVNINDPELVDIGFDVNGEMILAYKGVPFTGIEEEYFQDNPQQLATETEYKEGHMWGIYREYYPNGQLKLEYTNGKGGLDGPFREWDENGNLIRDSLYIEGEKQQ